MAITMLSVPAISCEHCERTIQATLGPVTGIRDVRVDIPARQVRVDSDERAIDTERIKTLLADEDYPVAAVTESA